MKKHIMCLFLVLALAVSCSTPAYAADMPFTDISTNSWYYDSLAFVYTMGIMSGTSTTKFSPNTSLTREAAVTVLGNFAQQMGLTITSSTNPFTDVKPGTYYYNYVCWAANEGIISGVTNSTFGVGKSITRQDMCVILYRFTYNYLNITLKNLTAVSTYADDANISSYAKNAVYACSRGKIVNGVGNNCFSPKGTLTRAQMAQIMTMYTQFHINVVHLT